MMFTPEFIDGFSMQGAGRNKRISTAAVAETLEIPVVSAGSIE